MTAAYLTVAAATLGTEVIAAPAAKNRRVVRSIYINSDTAMEVDLVSGYVNETQSVYHGATGGTFTLTYDGQTTSGIAYDANAALIKTRLEAISTITSVTVTGAGTSGDPWIVTFLDPGGADIALMTLQPASLTGAVTTIATDTPGVTSVDEVQSIVIDATGGSFALSYGGSGPTAAIPFDAADDSVAAVGTLTITDPLVPAVQAAGLLSIAEPVADGETITIDSTTYRFKTVLAQAYDVAIGANEAATKVNIIAAINSDGTPGVNYYTGTDAHPGVTAAAFGGDDAVITAIITGTAANSFATTETMLHANNKWDDTTMGTQVLGAVGDVMTIDSQVYRFLTITEQAYDIDVGADEAASKVNIVAALNASGTPGVEYYAGTDQHPTVGASVFSGDICTLTARTAGLAGDAIVTTEVIDAAGNVFNDTTLGATTAGSNGIVTELELLASITDVGVTGAGSGGSPWLVTFNDPGNADLALMTADDALLTGGGSDSTITEDTAGATGVNEVQSFYNNANAGTFTITYTGQTTSALAFDISAADLDTALQALSNVTAVTVTGTGTSGDPWIVTFTNPGGAIDECTATDTGLIEINVVGEQTPGAGTEKFAVHIGEDGVVDLSYNPGDEGWFECGSAESLNLVTSASGNVVVLLGYDTAGGS